MPTQTQHLQTLTRIIRDVADHLVEAGFFGKLTVTTKWGQPAFLPDRSRVGTTLRIDSVGEDQVGLFVLTGMPALMEQASWNISTAEPNGHGARVIGWWHDSNGDRTDKAAMLLSDRAVYFSHVVLSDDWEAKMHGLEVHVWKVNHNPGHHAPREFLDQMRKAGRTQVDVHGEVIDWLNFRRTRPAAASEMACTNCYLALAFHSLVDQFPLIPIFKRTLIASPAATLCPFMESQLPRHSCLANATSRPCSSRRLELAVRPGTRTAE